MEYPYYLIDVFTRQKFSGAQIAVFPDGDAFTSAQMQLLAQELNIPETVFLCSATDAVSQSRLKIFTPQAELEFAGHPIIAAGYVLQEMNSAPLHNALLQLNHESLGLHAAAVNGEIRVAFTLKTRGRLDNYVPSARELGDILHLDESVIDQTMLQPMLVNCNGEYLMVPVKSITAFNEARFNLGKWTTSFVATLASKIVLCCRVNPEEHIMHYRVRLLGKGIAVHDDPPVGSAAAAMGVYLFAQQADGIYKTVLQRGGDGRRMSLIDVTLEKSAGEVVSAEIGGYAVKAGRGVIYFDFANSEISEPE